MRTWYNVEVSNLEKFERSRREYLSISKDGKTRFVPAGTGAYYRSGKNESGSLVDMSDIREGLNSLGDLQDVEFPDALGGVAHLLVAADELPPLTVLLPVDVSPDPEACLPVENQQWAKPKGGLWTAPQVGAKSSSWVEWCRSEDFQPKDTPVMALWGVTPPADVTILRVSSLDEGRDVVDVFSEAETDGISKFYALIDYEGLRESGVDAIWLTEEAALEARREFFSSDVVPFNLWDCETVLWLNTPPETTFEKLGDVNL